MTYHILIMSLAVRNKEGDYCFKLSRLTTLLLLLSRILPRSRIRLKSLSVLKSLSISKSVLVSLWRRVNARNVWLYTNLFIFRFVSLLCLSSTLHLLKLATIFFFNLVPDKLTSAQRKQSKDHSSAKRNFVRRIIYKGVRKTPFHRDRSQVGKI